MSRIEHRTPTPYLRKSICEKEVRQQKPEYAIFDEEKMFRVCTYYRAAASKNDPALIEAQLAHSRLLTHDHLNWNMKATYADEEIVDPSIASRTQFNEMIEACKRGQYDLIVTKSLSRFSRNLDDCISCVEMLKGLTPPVGVYFEIDNLYSLGEDAERIFAFLKTIVGAEQATQSRLICSTACVANSTKWGKLRRHR